MIWVRHLRNCVLLGRDYRSFILRFRYRIFLCFFLSDVIMIPFRRGKPLGQFYHLFERTLLNIFPTDLLFHAFTEGLIFDLKEWILTFNLIDKLHIGTLSRVILRQLRARLVLIEDDIILVFHSFELSPFIVLFDIHIDATFPVTLNTHKLFL